jgi:hypothetical protein
VTFALAEGKEEPFLQLAKGNYWEYEVKGPFQEKATTGKIEIEKIDKDGKIKIKTSDMGILAGGGMAWKMSSNHLIWELGDGEVTWKVIKFNAKKNDSWTSKFREGGPRGEMTLTSKVVAIEDLKTPAGTFKGCLKVEHYPEEEKDEKLYTWWVKGVGLLKLGMVARGPGEISWTLKSYKVGPDISDKKLKEMVEKADIIALVSVPKDAEKSEKAQVSVSGTYKGELEAKDGKIEITQPGKDSKLKRLKEGDYLVFLKKNEGKLALACNAVKSQKTLTERLVKLLKPADKGDELLKSLCGKAETVAAVEVVKLEDRGEYQYYVVKVLSALKNAEEGKHFDVLVPTGVTLKEGGKHIMFLAVTKEHGRKMMRLVDVVRGVLDHKEETLKKLEEIVKSSK